MQQPVIAIKFCGGCNPRVDRGAVAAEMGALLTGLGRRVVFNELDQAALVIYLSGCTANCAERYSDDSRLPVIVIAGELIDGLTVTAAKLAAEAVAKAEAILRRLEAKGERE